MPDDPRKVMAGFNLPGPRKNPDKEEEETTTASGTVGLTARHTGSGWYEVEGEEGKVRKKDLPEGAIITD